MEAKIKVSAPAQNPHICYIHREYRDKINAIKDKTGMSLYNLLCVCGNTTLRKQEQIKEFKKELKQKGFKHIGEWAEMLVDFLYERLEDLNNINLMTIEIKPKEK